MDTEQIETNGTQDQLLEIYKLHVQQTNNMSNRRTTTSRFYQITLSGVLLFFFTAVQHKDKIVPKELSEIWTTEILMISLGFIGLMLSWTWFVSIDVYLDAISRKYDVLKKIETQLKFQFLTEEWELLDEKRKKQSYRKLAAREVFLPYLFYGVFFFLFFIGITTIENTFFLPLLIVPLYMLINISFRVKG